MTEDTKSKHATDFLQRCAEALDIQDPYWLAQELGVEYEDVQELWQGTRLQIACVDEDPVWTALAVYVDKRIGRLLSIREELQRKLSIERRQRAERRRRIAER